jgi:DNA-binding transcriptional LysR family regulator
MGLTMELRHLRYFLVVSETENIRMAASKLFITQPAISRQISDLEDELGVKLFDRLPRGIRLNPIGKMYQRKVRDILQKLDGANVQAKQMANGSIGHLRLGFIEVSGWKGCVPETINHFNIQYPQVTVELTTNNTPQLLQQLSNEQLDGVFIYIFDKLEEQFSAISIRTDSMVLAYPASWSEKLDRHVTVDQLNELPFISFPREVFPRYHDELMAQYAKIGFHPQISQLAHNESAILSMVSAGIGVALVNSSNLDRPAPKVHYISLEGLSMSLPLCFVWSTSNSSNVLELFHREVRYYLDEEQDPAIDTPKSSILKNKSIEIFHQGT